MKAVLDKNVRVSLPKAYQIKQKKNKCLAIKGVPTDITAKEFKEFLDLNKITYAKAERLKSKKDGRVLPIFQLEISDPAEAEALLSQNLVCNVTGIVYKVEEFVSPFRFGSASTANVSDIRRKIANQNKNVLSVLRTIPTKDAQKRSKTAQMCKLFWATCCILQRVSRIQKAGFQATCGQQPKILCRCSKPKFSPTAQNHTNVSIHSRTAHQICSQCGNPNRPATGVLPQS